MRIIEDEKLLLSDDLVNDLQTTIGYNVIAVPLSLYPRFILNIGNINRDVYNWVHKKKSYIIIVIKNKCNLPAMRKIHKDIYSLVGEDDIKKYFNTPRKQFSGLNNITNYSTYKISYITLDKIITDYKLDNNLKEVYTNLFYNKLFTTPDVDSNLVGSKKEIENKLNELYGIKKGE